MFSLFLYNSQHDLGNFSFIPSGLFFNLSKTSRIDIQSLHIDQNLVIIDFVHIVIQFVSRLW